MIAGCIAVYTLITLAGMLRYGARRWLDHGEVFSVYTGVLPRSHHGRCAR